MKLYKLNCPFKTFLSISTKSPESVKLSESNKKLLLKYDEF